MDKSQDKKTFTMVFPAVDWVFKERPMLPLRYSGDMQNTMDILNTIMLQYLTLKGMDTSTFSVDNLVIKVQCDISSN